MILIDLNARSIIMLRITSPHYLHIYKQIILANDNVGNSERVKSLKRKVNLALDEEE